MGAAQGKFPHLSKRERGKVEDFALHPKESRSILELVNNFYSKFLLAPSSSARTRWRRKLLDIAGLPSLLHPASIRSVLPEFHIAHSRFCSEQLNDMLPAGEYFPAALLRSPKFQPFLAIEVDRSATFQDLFGVQDEAGLPVVRSIVLRPHIEVEHKLPFVLSSTSEPITRTIFLATQKSGQQRDIPSLCYELIRQAEYLRCFYREKEDALFPVAARSRMTVRACMFALEIFELHFCQLIDSGEMILQNNIFLPQTLSLDLEEKLSYMRYLQNDLVFGAMRQLQEQCNLNDVTMLGLQDLIRGKRDYAGLRVSFQAALTET